jgi:nicotinate-nucleotide pyrophosphorylase (carboxylating)
VEELETLVARALAEDLGRDPADPAADVTTAATVPAGLRAQALISQKQPGVIYGLQAARTAFALLDADAGFEALVREGEWREEGGPVLSVRGRAAALLTAERTALNFLQHLSGVASTTRRWVRATQGKARIWDTRKTTPGLRALEKAAVRAGGGANHRGSLSDFVMVKDNHLTGLSIDQAVTRARRQWPGRTVEVECDTHDQVEQAVDAGADLVLLDNMSPDQVAACVSTVGGRCLVEVSGGITIDTLTQYLDLGVDLISAGSITNSAPVLDIGLDIEIVEQE